MFKFKGEVTFISEPVTGIGEKGDWAKREFVVESKEGDYPETCLFSLFKNGEYIDYALDKFDLQVGDVVEVDFSLRANKYKDRYFLNASAFKYTVLNKSEPSNVESQESEDIFDF